ncbi:MAG: aminotransferase class I/II-fold pyridoxal phosphate-dependent enzyme [Bacteroidia bacterium]|nr:aminotransferase class I/II-fold pyridoxal phosphate-dependent enzyme [Bacteroidia bacterium]
MINEISIPTGSTIQEALVNINANTLGMTFVVSNDNKLIGMVTDGDIRRGLIDGSNVNDEVNSIMNTSFTSLHIKSDNVEILKHLSERIRVIPLVGDQGELLDYASHRKLRRVSLVSPQFDEAELSNVIQCVKTGWVSSQGKFVREFEQQFRTYCKRPVALATSNGTVALHLAIEALGIGEGDEVLVPDLTFAASANSVLYAGARPILVDVERNSLMIDIEKAERAITPRTKAIMPVHLYGQIADMDKVMAFAKKHNLFVIEDCAEALGSTYKGQPVGSFGDAGSFSFFGNKIITTGEGGMVVFKSEEVGEMAAVLRDHGMDKTKRYWHNHIGFNYRMTNLQGALGTAQMEKLEHFVAGKRNVASYYDEAFKSVNEIETPYINPDVENCYWMYNIILSESCKVDRDEVMNKLVKTGIECRPMFYPLSDMPVYADYCTTDITESKIVAARGISLPSSPTLTEPELDFVIQNVRWAVQGEEANS